MKTQKMAHFLIGIWIISILFGNSLELTDESKITAQIVFALAGASGLSIFMRKHSVGSAIITLLYFFFALSQNPRSLVEKIISSTGILLLFINFGFMSFYSSYQKGTLFRLSLRHLHILLLITGLFGVGAILSPTYSTHFFVFFTLSLLSLVLTYYTISPWQPEKILVVLPFLFFFALFFQPEFSEVVFKDGAYNIYVQSEPVLLQGEENHMRIVVANEKNNAAVDTPIRIDMITSEKTIPLFQGKTDKHGTVDAKIKISDEIDSKAKLKIIAGDTVKSESLDMTFPVKKLYRTLITTDKSFYKPGQTVHVRTLTWRVGNTQSVAAGENITFVFEDPKGNKLIKETQQTDEYGITSKDIPLASELTTGKYSIIVIAGDIEQKQKITIDYYKLPIIKFKLDTNKKWFKPNDLITGEITTDYFFGQPAVGDVTLTIMTYQGKWEESESYHGSTDENGVFNLDALDIRAPSYAAGMPVLQGKTSKFKMHVSIEDKAKRIEEKDYELFIANEYFTFNFFSNPSQFISLEPLTVYGLIKYPDGQAAADTMVTIRCKQNMCDKEVYEVDTDATGLVQFTLTPKKTDKLEFDVHVKDKKGFSGDHNFSLSAREFISGYRVRVLPEKTSYTVGEEIRANILVERSGEIKVASNSVYIDVVRATTMYTTSETLAFGKASVSLTTQENYVPSVKLRAYVITPSGDVVSDVAKLSITNPNALKIDISTDKEEYDPAGMARLLFKVLDKDGGAVPNTALAISVVDTTVRELEEKMKGFEEVFFTSEEAYQKPIATIYGFDFTSGENKPDRPSIDVMAEPMPMPRRRSRGKYHYRPPQRKQTILLKEKANITNLGNPMQVAKSWENTDTLKEDVIQAKRKELNKKFHSAFPFIMFSFIVFILVNSLFGGGPKFPGVTTIVGGIVLIIIGGSLFVFSSMMFSGSAKTSMMESASIGSARGDMMLERASAGPGRMRNLQAMAKSAVDTGIMLDEAEMAFDADFEEKDKADMVAKGEDLETGEQGIAIRWFFPETAFWTPKALTNEKGEFSLDMQMAHSITTWDVKVIASTKDARIGIGNKNALVFKDFFVEPDIPLSVTQYDEITLNVAVFNYADRIVKPKLWITEEDWFELLDEKEKQLSIEKGGVTSVTWTIKILKAGKHPITIYAKENELEDAVRKIMTVKPNGVLIETFEKGALKGTISSQLTSYPEVIENSQKFYVRLSPGVIAPAVEGLESLMKYPHGCVEQTSSSFIPNVLIYRYFSQKGDISPEFKAKSDDMVLKGIQRLLSFHHDDGGFGWWTNDESVPFMTAYVMWGFGQARKAGYFVDTKITNAMEKWLVDKQNSDGSWPSSRAVCHSSYKINGQVDELYMTVFAVRGLALSLETGSTYPHTRNAIKKGISYLDSHLIDIAKDPYLAGIALLAYHEAQEVIDVNTNNMDTIAQYVSGFATVENEDVFWAMPVPQYHYHINDDSTQDSAEPNIEATCYSITGLAKSSVDSTNVQKSIKWLIKSRERWDKPTGPSSTFDTLSTIYALVESAEAMSGDTDMTAAVTFNDEIIFTKHITGDAVDVTEIISLSDKIQKGTNSISLTKEGNGFLTYQIIGEEYLESILTGKAILGEQQADGTVPLTVTLTPESTNVLPSSVIVRVIGNNFKALGGKVRTLSSAKKEGTVTFNLIPNSAGNFAPERVEIEYSALFNSEEGGRKLEFVMTEPITVSKTTSMPSILNLRGELSEVGVNSPLTVTVTVESDTEQDVILKLFPPVGASSTDHGKTIHLMEGENEFTYTLTFSQPGPSSTGHCILLKESTIVATSLQEQDVSVYDNTLLLDQRLETYSIDVNDEVTVYLRVKNFGGDVAEYLVVESTIPPGFSFKKETLEQTLSDNVLRYDFLSDRKVAWYIKELQTNKQELLTYKIKALYPVKAVMDGASTELMYDTVIHSETPDQSIVVTDGTKEDDTIRIS